MARIFHVFKTPAKRWTRCGERVKSYDRIFAFEKARDPFYWRQGSLFIDTAICAACARRR